MLQQLQRQLSQKFELLPIGGRVTTYKNTRYSPLGSDSPTRGHRRQISLSSFNPRKAAWFTCAGLFLLAIALITLRTHVDSGAHLRGSIPADEDPPIPLGQSVDRDGREVFWWEQFPRLNGYYRGRHDIVLPSEYVPEQEQQGQPFKPLPSVPAGLTHSVDTSRHEIIPCAFSAPIMPAYDGLPQGMPSPLLGSLEEMGINTQRCYDRVHRYGPYGLDTTKGNGGLGIELHGENARDNELERSDFANVKWHGIQEECVRKNEAASKYKSRTVFVLRTWHTFEYTAHHILMLRAMMNELSLRSGGQISLHFLIHVQDDSLPIWASEETYNETLKASLPEEFQGMGTLWSVAQMKLIYPPPFPKSIVNFSGGNVYEAYRSLHFPLQYFASKHPEFDYFWQWEMDIRVTGHYGELLDKITAWADRQSRDHLWERSSKYFIPALHNNSYAEFTQSIVKNTANSRQTSISGPQLPQDQLLPVPPQTTEPEGQEITDLITFSPLFNPARTRWAFHDDITGYPDDQRPPTRAALIAASRMSRRLLLLMHEETYQKKHTMFPEMYPASVALHYGLKAVYAPITNYFDRDWPAEHANEIFNNDKVGQDGIAAGMDHGEGYFHGPGGSVFGPGEHVFRGASWYSNALFAEYLWKRWLGNENKNGEIEWEFGDGHGRMCLPMMILHPIKHDT